MTATMVQPPVPEDPAHTLRGVQQLNRLFWSGLRVSARFEAVRAGARARPQARARASPGAVPSARLSALTRSSVSAARS
jgi:hypothetical protein